MGVGANDENPRKDGPLLDVSFPQVLAALATFFLPGVNACSAVLTYPLVLNNSSLHLILLSAWFLTPSLSIFALLRQKGLAYYIWIIGVIIVQIAFLLWADMGYPMPMGRPL